jgi:hypothetical protein
VAGILGQRAQSEDQKQRQRYGELAQHGGVLSCSQPRIENGKLRAVWERHTGVSEGMPSSEAALGCAHGSKHAKVFGAPVF